MTETLLQDAIFNWLQPVLNLWKEGRDTGATPRAPGQCQMFWHMQEAPRVDTPILMGVINGLEKVGRDYYAQPLKTTDEHDVDHITQKSNGTRNFSLHLQYFGNDALTQLSKVVRACDNQASLDTLRAGGATAVFPHPIIEAHTFLGTTPEDRAILDIDMRTSDYVESTDEVGIIEEVKAEGKIDAVTEIELDVIKS